MEENNRYTQQDERLRALLADAEETPSEKVWDKILLRLDKQDRGRHFIFWLSCIVLFMVSAGGVLYYYRTSIVETNHQHTTQPSSMSTEKDSIYPSLVTMAKKPDAPLPPQDSSASPSGSEKAAVLHNMVANKRSQANAALSSLSRHKSNIYPALTNQEQSASAAGMMKEKPTPQTSSSHSMPQIVAPEIQTMIVPNIDSFQQTVNEKPPDIDTAYSYFLTEKALSMKVDMATTFISPRVETLSDSNRNDPIKLSKQSRNCISIYFSPEYSNNKSGDFNGQSVSDEIQINRYAAGITYSRSLHPHVSVRVGFSYSEFHQKLNEHKITFGRFITEPFIFHSSLGDMPVDPDVMREGYDPPLPNFPTQFSFMYTYYQKAQFILLPVEAVVHINMKRFTYSCIGGIQSQFVIRQHATLYLLKEHQTNTLSYSNLNMKTVSFAATAGLRVEYRIFNTCQVFFEPHARINFSRFNSNSDVKSMPFFSGVSLGASLPF